MRLGRAVKFGATCHMSDDDQTQLSDTVVYCLLCATKVCRVQIKNSGAYYVLRELQKTEICQPVLVACENLVSILIGDDTEPGMENLKKVDISEHIVNKFEG
ncbi:hypothetical protein HPB50_011305 [Hyalomma asiaticum]|uniref:Uncharacterized protein n=1 Tax=Hyalomma asiaticum TaxID=266040 RepID=A0ACB7RTA4_HYAAI|nr:hypothetical protein HPB50_011305 [Hyalomma asiaticum]